MSYPQIPEWFRSDDIIYHYTSSETAICHILDNMKLKLSPRKASIDPFENSDIAHKINMGTELGYSPEIQKNGNLNPTIPIE